MNKRWSLISIFILLFTPSALADDAYQTRREAMVRTQITERGIRDKATLQAMRAVPRHLFVPPHLADSAYEDQPLPIGYGQTISQPYIVAFMTELIRPKATQKVLEIGSGSGYQAAVLAEIVKQVYTIEIVPELAQEASETLARLGYTNIHGKFGDGYLGWPDEAPFDAIIVTCAPDNVPPILIGQLREGGRLVIPVGAHGHPQQLYLLEKINGKVQQRSVTSVIFVPMVHGKR